MVGIHRLAMKAASDNFRTAKFVRFQGVMKRLKAKGVEVLLYEPLPTEDLFLHTEVVRDLDEFKERSDVIVGNRRTQDIADVEDKVYTRDLFGSD